MQKAHSAPDIKNHEQLNQNNTKPHSQPKQTQQPQQPQQSHVSHSSHLDFDPLAAFQQPKPAAPAPTQQTHHAQQSQPAIYQPQQRVAQQQPQQTQQPTIFQPGQPTAPPTTSSYVPK